MISLDISWFKFWIEIGFECSLCVSFCVSEVAVEFFWPQTQTPTIYLAIWLMIWFDQNTTSISNGLNFNRMYYWTEQHQPTAECGHFGKTKLFKIKWRSGDLDLINDLLLQTYTTNGEGENDCNTVFSFIDSITSSVPFKRYLIVGQPKNILFPS